MFDPKKIKADFPIFISNKGLIYLDSAATSLKPKLVLDKLNDYYTKYSANIYRGIYKLSEKATAEYEKVREKVAHFIGAKDSREIVFVRNATEAINLIANGLIQEISEHNEILVTVAEHHANFVTWQQLAKRKKAKFHPVSITDEGYINEKELLHLINESTKVVGFFHVSNVLGTITRVKELVANIKKKNPNCIVVIDGAQAIPHLKVDVSELGCDFYMFSSHKMLGPTGVGVLWGKYELLHKMPPYQYGGEMIQAVYQENSEFKDTPQKFEAGTPHIAGVIGLGAAIDYLEKLGMVNIRKHEIDLVSYALKKLKSLKGLKIYGPEKAEDRTGVLSFTIGKIHAHDIAQILDSNNICVRSGHHCAMPLHLYLGVNSTARASFYVYTIKEDVDEFVNGLIKVQLILN